MKAVFAPTDYEGLQAAIPALLDRAARAKDRHRMDCRAAASLAHELWLGHLFALDEMASVTPLAPEALSEPELRGLAILRRAREKFRAEHFQCRCGAILPNYAGFCGQCGEKYRQPAGSGTVR